MNVTFRGQHHTFVRNGGIQDVKGTESEASLWKILPKIRSVILLADDLVVIDVKPKGKSFLARCNLIMVQIYLSVH